MVDAIRRSAEEGNRIIVLIDDAYFGLNYDERAFSESFFAPLADLHENVLAVKIDGASKEEFAWGFRVAFLTYGIRGLTPEQAEALADKTAGAIRATVSNAPLLQQHLMLRAFNSPTYDEEKRKNAAMLRERYEAAMRALREPAHEDFFRMLPCNSGYFFCVELREGIDAEQVRQMLLADFDTGVIALGSRLLRIAFSSVPVADIPRLVANMIEVCKKTTHTQPRSRGSLPRTEG